MSCADNTMDGPSSISDTCKDRVKNVMDHRTKVYIWDMDETLILLKSLLNGTYANGFSGSKDVKKGLEIGEMWEKLILDLCDGYFFYDQVSALVFPFFLFVGETV